MPRRWQGDGAVDEAVKSIQKEDIQSAVSALDMAKTAFTRAGVLEEKASKLDEM